MPRLHDRLRASWKSAEVGRAAASRRATNMIAIALGMMMAAPNIPYVDPGKAPPDLVQSIEARRPNHKLLNLDLMLLNSPEFAKGWNTMFGAIRGKLSVPAKLREISILAVAVLNDAPYEWVQHEPEFLKAGGTQDELAAIQKLDGSKFDEAGQVTFALATEMTRNIKVSAATMARAKKALPNDQLVELIGTIAGYNMVSRFLIATGVEAESK
jgi:alkylhydroperoxidase family enzyme